MKQMILLAASALLFVGGTARAQPADCPWKLAIGHWQLTGPSGDASDVVFKVADGDSIIGIWDGKDGKATELVGWRADTKELVATGYGTKRRKRPRLKQLSSLTQSFSQTEYGRANFHWANIAGVNGSLLANLMNGS